MSGRRLYRVELRLFGYVLAADEFEAENAEDEIMATEDDCGVSVRSVDRAEIAALGSGQHSWDGSCLVYHDGDDEISVDDAIAEHEATLRAESTE